MLIEIRRYTIVEGRREEFVEWFEEEVIPAMEAVGMRILGVFVGVDDDQAFYYLRGFESEEERELQTAAFYESEDWLGGMRQVALEMEEDYQVELVRSTPRSPI